MPGNKAICPICKSEVIAKCGEINVWHWAHVSSSNCDDWVEPDNSWQRDWKNRYPIDKREIVINGRVADIVTERNDVIKLRNSYISPNDIYKIEQHFKNMIWIFNVADCEENFKFWPQIGGGNKIYHKFRWKHARKHIAYASKSTILDLGFSDKLFILKKIAKKPPFYGWGHFITLEEFLRVRRFTLNSHFNRTDNKY